VCPPGFAACPGDETEEPTVASLAYHYWRLLT